ncbi:D-alanyl-D-alanine carboxypeptidase family protein [Acidisphaera sp. S103]|uniref:D-alanyl-D-alanine carboxypeptidase family protein n=1 Tax=Acidisphaera sp. S103 TaxID=1747223 RepID=UPI00131DD2E4|nr:D-alanyl-D-alanine carboxypeptidase family protein [Acidisphaera sp. S103]
MVSVACLVGKQLSRGLLAAGGLASWLLATVAITVPAHAQVGSARYSSIVVDAGTGDVLEDMNADEPRHPASLAKMMTLYMTFEALRDRRINLDTVVPVSSHAASMEPTKLGLMPGTHLVVEQAILGLVTKSANDAAAALGELLGGSEDRFAQMMTLRARALGMGHSTFTNASGLPDPNEWTTARDMAVLGRRLINDFPGYYRYFSTPSFAWHRQIIFNHDNMLRTYPGADGLKTGYTDASGHNLVTSAVHGGVRLVGVVLGAATNGERDIQMTSLLDHGFEQMDVPAFHKPVLMASRVTLIATAHAAEVTRPVSSHTRVMARIDAEQMRPATVPVSARARVVANWVVQVGTFPTEAAAHTAAMAARREAEAGEVRIEPVHLRKKTIWRAQVMGLTQSDAQDACSGHRKGACLMIRPVTRQVASR